MRMRAITNNATNNVILESSVDRARKARQTLKIETIRVSFAIQI